jgi:hypothetical protein
MELTLRHPTLVSGIRCRVLEEAMDPEDRVRYAGFAGRSCQVRLQMFSTVRNR